MALLLTYAELADRIGRSEPAAKSLAKRKRWRRSVGNDGLTRITIDEPELVELADPDRRGVGRPPANSSRAAQSGPPPEPGSNPVQTIIADLQARLAVAEALAEERKGAVAVEQDKAERLVGEVADLARQLARVVGEAGDREKALRDETAQVRAQLDAWRARPWWSRLVG